MASKYKESTSFSPFCPTGTILPYLGNTLPSGWNWLYPTGASLTLKCSNSAYGATFGTNTKTIPTGGITHKHNTSTTPGMVQSINHTHDMNDDIAPSNTGGLTRTFEGGNTTGFANATLTTDNSAFNNHTTTMTNAGSGQSFSILNPYFTVHWIIKL